MARAKSTIQKHLRELRKLIDTEQDTTLMRVAYTMETAIKWATEDNVNWPGLVEQAREAADYIEKGI